MSELFELFARAMPKPNAATDYAIALQRAIEHHCRGQLVPPHIATECPHHAAMLNERADRDEIKRLKRLLERAQRFIGARAGEKPEPALDLLLAIEREFSAEGRTND